MELARPLYSYFLIFVEVGNLQMELARPLYSYFSFRRVASSMELASPVSISYFVE